MLHGLAAPITDAAKRRQRMPIFWEFDEQTGKMTLIGIGPLPDYTEQTPAPWESFKEQIKTIEVSAGVTRIGGQNFAGCANLTAVTLADTVRTIGYRAFGNCRMLQTVDTPRRWAHAYEKQYRAQKNPEDDGSIRLGMGVFDGTPWQEKPFGEWCIADGVLIEYYGTAEEIRIPLGVQEIGPMAFEGKPVKHVTFSRTVRSIGTCAFRSTYLLELILPGGIQDIGEYAFSNIAVLQYVLIRNKKMTVADTAFCDTPVHAEAVRKNGKWDSIYGLNRGKAIGEHNIRQLSAGMRTGHPIGISSFQPDKEFLKKIRSGNMILRLRLDREQKKVEFVQAYAKHPYYGLFTYVQYPCIHGDTWEPYSDDTTHIDEDDILNCDKDGLWPAREDSNYVWYIVRYEREADYWAAFEVWTQWLISHPDYRVDSADYQHDNLERKIFPD